LSGQGLSEAFLMKGCDSVLTVWMSDLLQMATMGRVALYLKCYCHLEQMAEFYHGQ
jgi:hypothetical protein